MRVAVVRNPVSGRGKGDWGAVEGRLREAFPGMVVEATTASGSARGQARRLALAGFDVVAAAGGDGTVNQVMQGILGSHAALAVIPMGTGNDLARTLGFGPNPEKAVAALIAGKTSLIDVAKWSQGDHEGHFVNVAGCGFDAVVARRINQGFRSLRGTSAYLAAIVQTLASYRATELTVVADGEEIRRRAMLAAVANAQSYGGGMRIAPLAELSDGFLDLVLVGELGKFEFLRSLPRLLKGTHLSHPKVLHRRVRRVEIVSDPPVPFLVDGELVSDGPVVVEIVPGALRVCR